MEFNKPFVGLSQWIRLIKIRRQYNFSIQSNFNLNWKNISVLRKNNNKKNKEY